MEIFKTAPRKKGAGCWSQAKFVEINVLVSPLHRQLYLPVNALEQNMFSRDVKRLSFRCQTFKFSRPNVKCSA